LLAAAALAWPVAAFSQAPEKTVPVRDEPRHRVALENAHIRLIDVRFSPGTTTLYHTHTIPSVIVELSDSTIVTQEWGAAPAAPRHVAPGETRYAPYDEKPLTHRVTNAGSSEFHVLDIELLRPPASAGATPPATAPGLKLDWEQPLVRLYQLALAPDQRSEVPVDGCAYLVVGIEGTVQTGTSSDGATSTHELKAGEYRFFTPGSRFQIVNHGQDAARCVLLQLK
jgi:quercetin dioxygenase-like cupin family protein